MFCIKFDFLTLIWHELLQSTVSEEGNLHHQVLICWHIVLFWRGELRKKNKTLDIPGNYHYFFSGVRQVPVGYVGLLLEGFRLASVPSPARKIYIPPNMPTTYKPVHRFATTTAPATQTQQHTTARQRATTLGEKPEFSELTCSAIELVDKQTCTWGPLYMY